MSSPNSTAQPAGPYILHNPTQDKNEIIQYIVPPGTDITLRARPKEDYGPFQAISPLSRSQSDSPDIFDRLAQTSQCAFDVFNKLKHTRNLDNALCCYKMDQLASRSDRVMFNRGVRLLIDQDIIKRVPVKNDLIKVRKGTYMMNPTLIKCRKYHDACSLWKRL